MVPLLHCTRCSLYCVCNKLCTASPRWKLIPDHNSLQALSTSASARTVLTEGWCKQHATFIMGVLPGN
jgi:hypothetical protein